MTNSGGPLYNQTCKRFFGNGRSHDYRSRWSIDPNACMRRKPHESEQLCACQSLPAHAHHQQKLPKFGFRTQATALWLMERSSILSTKFDCPVHHQDLSLSVDVTKIIFSRLFGTTEKSSHAKNGLFSALNSCDMSF